MGRVARVAGLAGIVEAVVVRILIQEAGDAGLEFGEGVVVGRGARGDDGDGVDAIDTRNPAEVVADDRRAIGVAARRLGLDQRIGARPEVVEDDAIVVLPAGSPMRRCCPIT